MLSLAAVAALGKCTKHVVDSERQFAGGDLEAPGVLEEFLSARSRVTPYYKHLIFLSVGTGAKVLAAMVLILFRPVQAFCKPEGGDEYLSTLFGLPSRSVASESPSETRERAQFAKSSHLTSLSLFCEFNSS